ncbi:hypothetical protein [Planococcus sp. YIM B11945]|uniref:hypothetical protein n=1 Tax=Planococcus sp. YIM B11945 TaxID=3435410 RepID=UPI003D7E9366
MKKSILYKKAALDIFWEQAKWSAWFFAVLIVIHAVVMYFNLGNETEVAGFFEFSRYSTSIFMLVCGILAAYGFMTYFVQQGISRKDVYRGIALAALGLAIALTLIPLFLNGIEYLLVSFTPLELNFMSPGSSADWFWETIVYMLNVFTFYLVGWMISIGYYRFGWLIGFAFIALAIIAFSFNDYFWGDTGLTSFIPWLPKISMEATPFIGIIGSLVLIAVLLAFIHSLTKRVAIKMY